MAICRNSRFCNGECRFAAIGSQKRNRGGNVCQKNNGIGLVDFNFIFHVFIFTILASSEQIIKLFASGFDQNRLSIGRSMLFWLLPYTISTILKSGFDIWAQHSGKYSLSAFASSFSGLLSLIAFLATYSWLGVFSIPFSFSFSWFIVSLLTKLGVRDFPFCLADFDRNSVFEILKPTLLSLIFLGTGALYGMTDRYFASLLPIGSITTISYADFIFGAVSIITTPSLLLFLSKSSRLAANASSTNDYTSFYSSVTQALVIVLFLFFPLGIVLSGVSISLVDIVIGHGAFSFDSVILTGNCLAAYALAMPASLGCVVFFRIAQAQKKTSRASLCEFTAGMCQRPGGLGPLPGLRGPGDRRGHKHRLLGGVSALRALAASGVVATRGDGGAGETVRPDGPLGGGLGVAGPGGVLRELDPLDRGPPGGDRHDPALSAGGTAGLAGRPPSGLEAHGAAGTGPQSAAPQTFGGVGSPAAPKRGASAPRRETRRSRTARYGSAR